MASQAEILPSMPAAVKADKAISTGNAVLLAFAKQFISSMGWILQKVKVQPKRRSLRLCENLPLGDKRFVAVIQVEEERFLIGGAAGSVSLLTRLQETANFSESLQTKLKEEAAR